PGASLALARRGLRNKIVLHQPLPAHYRNLQRCMKMQVRPAKIGDTDAAIDVVRRSILELCEPDHKGDSATLSAWLSNKTADNMRQWIDAHTVLVAIDDDERIAGVAAVRDDGVVLLNYV